MDARTSQKITVLVIAAVVIILALCSPYPLHRVGLRTAGSLASRLAFPFFHAGILHAALNAWCLLAIGFTHRVSTGRILLAYLVAVSAPAWCFSPIPTVGLSAVVYFLFGSLSFQVRRKFYFQAYMVLYLALAIPFPAINLRLHLYCYLFGLLFALLDKPVRRR